MNHFLVDVDLGFQNSFFHSIHPPSSSTRTTRSNSQTSENTREIQLGVKTNFTWKFKLTFAPFLAFGFPVHLLFGKQKISSTSQWLKLAFNFCSHPFLSVCSVIILFISTAYNFYCLLCVWGLLDQFVIVAHPAIYFFGDLLHLFQSLVIIVPMNYFWLYGYEVRNLLASMKFINVPITIPEEPDKNTSKIPSSYIISPHLQSKTKLIFFYLTIILTSVLSIVIIFSEQSKIFVSVLDILLNHLLHFWTGIFVCILIFPLYSTFCWAARYEFQLLSYYIVSLIEDKTTADLKILLNIKKTFKSIADQIVEINSMFSLYFTLMGPVLMMSLFKGWLAFLLLFLIISFEDDETYQYSAESARGIRILTGNFSVLMTIVCLFGYTIWQAVKTNDDARYLHVLLNDFIMMSEDKVETDVVQAFRMLQSYIHSRMEKQPCPALLQIMGVTRLPFIGQLAEDRMWGYYGHFN